MSILVSQLKTLGLPERFTDLLPEVCPLCESDYQITEALTGLSCTNPYCGSKVKERISAICKVLQIKGFGASRISKFIEYYDIINPMDIFDLQPGYYLGEGISQDVADGIIEQIVSIRENREFRLWEAVALCNLPGIQGTAHKVFSEFSDIEEAYQALTEGGVAWVQEKMNHRTKKGEVGTAALKVYTTLKLFEEQVKESVSYLNITSNDLPELTVAISDSVGSRGELQFPTKPVFQEYMRNRYRGVVSFNFVGTVSKRVGVLVWSGADGGDESARYTSKVSKAERYNSQGAEIPILTGPQLIDFLDSDRDLSELYLYSVEVNKSAVVGTANEEDITDDFYGEQVGDLF